MISIARLIAASGLMIASGLLFAGQPVDVNNADAATLAKSLDGVGMAKAEAIIQYRTEHGPFRSAEELVNVKGIGLKTVEMNREFIRISDKPATPAAPTKR